MNWRRPIFYIVFFVAFVPLWVMFVLGYMAEGFMQRLNALDRWSMRRHA